MSEQIQYFVFTSGESGVNGLDWGVKYVSSGLGTAENVDILYRNLVGSFNLKPSLERPEKGPGLLLLPLASPDQDYCLLGFIWPYQDSKSQGQRPNIALLACKIPCKSLQKINVTPDQVVSALLNIPSFVKIALRTNDRPAEYSERPDFLVLDTQKIKDQNLTTETLPKWPYPDEGYLSIDGFTKNLIRIPESHVLNQAKPFSSEKNYKLLIAGIAACLVLIIVLVFLFRGSKSESELDLAHNKQPEAQVQDKSLDQPHFEEKTLLPEKNALEALPEIINLLAGTSIQYVTLLTLNQRQNLERSQYILDLRMFDIEDGSDHVLDKKMSFAKLNTENLFITQDNVICFFNKAINSIFFQKDTASKQYRPLEITTKIDLNNNFEALSKCITLEKIPKVKKTIDINTQGMQHFKHQIEQNTKAELINQIAFMSKTSNNISKFYYLKQNAGRGTKIIKGALYSKSKFKYISKQSIFEKYKIMFEYDYVNSQRIWTLKGRFIEVQDEIEKITESDQKGKLKGDYRKKAIKVISQYIWNKI